MTDDLGAFAQALLDAEAAPPCGLPARRFAVYRNNVVVGLVDLLAARFPVCQRLVGEEFFRAMADVYLRGAPPQSKILHEYGESFPQFIESFAPARELFYLADVARLEYAIGLAYHAADAEPAPLAAIAATAPQALLRATLRLHPSLRLVASRFPVVSIWRVNLEGAEPKSVSFDGGEDALVIRNLGAVEAHPLPPGGFAFLDCIAEGAPVEDAIAQSVAFHSSFDLTSCLRLLLASNAIVAVEAQISQKENTPCVL